MWIGLEEEIGEMFADMQCESIAQFHEPSPFLNDEEVDEQDWQAYIQLTTPMAPMADFPCTCDRVAVYGRRWKNQYGEGEYEVVTVTPAISWGEQDYQYMSYNKCEYDYGFSDKPFLPPPPLAINVPEEKEPPLPPTVPANTVPEKSTDATIRIQLTMKRKGQNIRGQADNFMVHNVSCEKVVQLLEPLRFRYPKNGHWCVRVQIQKLVCGKYVGGGNLQLYGTVVETITQEIRIILEQNNIYAPKSVPKTKYSVPSERKSLLASLIGG